MPPSRFLLSISVIALASMSVLSACSSEDKPPYLDPSGDAGGLFDTGVQQTPCDPPSEGCPCTDVDAGTQLYCGVVYRVSGTHVDCSKGYRTCLDTGKWGACLGPTIYTGD